jgi:hypothetical protein
MGINHTCITHEATRCVTFSNVMLPLVCHLNASISRRTHSRIPNPFDDTSWRILPHQKMTVWGRNLSNLTYSETNPMPTFLLYNHMWLFYSYLQQGSTYIYSFFFWNSVTRGAEFPRQDEQDMRFQWNHVFDRLIKHGGPEVLNLLLYNESIHCVYSFSADCWHHITTQALKDGI